MRILKQSRLVRYRREGKMVYFRLDDDHVKEILNLGIKHSSE
jgi:ArsR family transcriptional regulator